MRLIVNIISEMARPALPSHRNFIYISKLRL